MAVERSILQLISRQLERDQEEQAALGRKLLQLYYDLKEQGLEDMPVFSQPAVNIRHRLSNFQIGNRQLLDEKMSQSDLTAKDIASELGISESYLSFIRNGKRSNINFHIAQQLADILDLSLDELQDPPEDVQ